MAEPRPFNDIAAGFDPNMPAELYEQVQRKYFDDVVKPRLGRADNHLAAWNQFKTNTERKSTLSTSGKIALPAAQFVTGVTHAITKPLSGLAKSDDGVNKAVERIEKSLTKTAMREGRSNVPTAIGEFAGAVIPFALASETAGASLEVAGLDSLSTGYRLLKGGLAFSAFEAASAEDGNRLTAGVKGFGTGLAFEGTLGLAGKLLRRGVPSKEIDEIVTKSLAEAEAPPAIDEIIAKEVRKDAKASRAEGRPAFVKEDPKFKGVGVILHDADGKPVTIKVDAGKEADAVSRVLDITKRGGVVDGILHHPNSVGLANRFMRASADNGAENYEGVKVIRTAEGQARRIALEDELDGKPTVPVSDNEVVVQDPKRSKPHPSEIEVGVGQLKDEEGYELPKGARMQIQRGITALWDKAVPDARKEMVADQLKHWELGDLIPQEWRREKPVGVAPEAEPSDMVARARELGLSEAEVNRLQEISEKEPSRAGLPRYEGKPPQPMFNIIIPESEEMMLEQSPEGPREISLGVTPRRFGLQVPLPLMQRAIPGSRGITVPPMELDQALERLGIPPTGLKTGVLPSVVYEGNPHRSVVYHEGLHVDKYHVPGGAEILQGEGNAAADSIANGLKKFRSYTNQPEGSMREEAFVHAATAIRTGDAHYLSDLTKMDGTLEDVFAMVTDRAERLLEATKSGIDSAPSRILQRKMQDLLLRTSPERSWEMQNQTMKYLGDSWYDPEAKVWKFKSHGQVAEETYQSYKELIDSQASHDGSEWAPSHTLWAEARGVRGPFTPRGGGPTGDNIAMDTPPNTRWKGLSSITGWFRPMGPWVASIDTDINNALSKFNRRLPIYDRWKDVDEAYRSGDQWLQNNYDEAAKLLEGLGKKQNDYFNVLVTDPKHWPEMAKQLNLGEKDIQRITQIDNWLGKLRDDTGILVKNYLRDEFPRLRGFGYNTERVYGSLKKEPAQMSTFERLITEGKIDPRSTHIGSFMDTMLREGFSKKFTDKPLKELEKLVGQKAKDGSYVLGNLRHPLENYTKYMRGIPDATGQIMNQTVADFTKYLGEKAKVMNKNLPSYAQLPTEFAYPKALINKLLVWSYAAGLGLRASIPIRDAMQVFSTAMPVLGPKRFMVGLMKGLSKEGWEFSDASGALLKKRNIGDLYGDLFNELPAGASTDRVTKLANRLLAPSRWGHNVTRNIAFNGEYASALEGVQGYRAGRVTIDELVKDHTSLWFNDKPVVERIIGQLHDTGFSDEEIAKNIALETIDLTLWPYRRGTQPSILRTGMGRVFGQFGMWPMNYGDFLRRGAQKFTEYPDKALGMTALWAASNYAAVSSMNAIGADAGKWFWFSPAAIDMSPHLKFVEDLGAMWKDSQDGREARRRVIEYPLSFFPTSVEMRNISKALESDEEPFDSNGHPTPALLRVLGFTPLKEQPDRDFEEEVKRQLGYGKEKKF